MSFYLDLFLELIDRIIQLSEFKKKGRQELISEVVEPLFTNLDPVVTDYFTMLDFVIYSLENKVHSRLELSQIVNKNSEKYLVLRRKLQTMAKTIMENVQDEDIKQFAFEVDAFFHPVWFEVNISPYRYTESVLAKEEGVVNFYYSLTTPDDPQWLREIDMPEFRKTRKFLEKKWQSIVKIYTTLKIDTINPKKQRNLFKGWGKSK